MDLCILSVTLYCSSGWIPVLQSIQSVGLCTSSCIVVVVDGYL